MITRLRYPRAVSSLLLVAAVVLAGVLAWIGVL